MAYTKTNWNENTPITVDKLNKIETGIANSIDKTEQIMEIPITNSEGWQQFRWTRPETNTVSWTRDALAGKALEIYNETNRKQLLLLNDDGVLTTFGNLKPQGSLAFSNLGGGGLNANIHNTALHAYTGNGQMMAVGSDRIYVGNSNTHLTIESNSNPIVDISGSKYNLYHTGNKPTANEIGALPLSGGTLTGTLGINEGKLTFSKQIGGGQMSSLINCQELQNNTGNGQMLTASSNRIYVGNPNTQLTLESGSNPIVNVGGTEYQLYHTGNKPTAGQIGAMSTNGPTFSGNLNQNGPNGYDWVYHINADRGTLNIAPKENGAPNWGKQIYINRNGQIHCNGNRRVATINQENPAHHMIRYGSGMGGENGYITFSW